MKKTIFLSCLCFCIIFSNAQNVGIGTATPQAMLNIKGNADTSQLVIDANATQSNLRPLIRIRNAAGFDLLHIHTDDESNIFIGKGAGRLNTISGPFGLGKSNSFLGSGAGNANSVGQSNSAMGFRALFSNTTGSYNTASGANALLNNTTATENTAIGFYALYSNTTGNNNTATGAGSLNSNTTGSDNTSNGRGALTSNTVGYSNTATGAQSLFFNTTGTENTANGHTSLFNNTTGRYNTAVGESALFNNTTSFGNTANGDKALYSNTTGSYNTGSGYNSLYYNTTGSHNTAYGIFSLRESTGELNTSIGSNSLYANITGNRNTAIGAYADVASGNLTNATAIGAGARVPASNMIRLGNEEVTLIVGQVAYSYPSDARFKYNIKSNVPGLEFIKKLTPVTYYFDEDKFSEYTKTGLLNTNTAKDTSNNADKDSPRLSKQLHTGFLAQDVEKIAKDMGYEFDGLHAPANERDNYSIAYSQFIMPLVKSVQEQQAIIEDQQKQIIKLKDQLVEMEKAINSLRK